MTPDEDLFDRAGKKLSQRTPAEQRRAEEHARSTQIFLASEERHQRRRRAQLGFVFRAAGATALAATVLFIARMGARMPVAMEGLRRDSVATFTLDAGNVTRVALVGEFNDWNPRATPMARARDGSWQVHLPVAPGRHTYAFVVNDTVWTADPRAPRSPERWFGDPRSVLVVASRQ